MQLRKQGVLVSLFCFCNTMPGFTTSRGNLYWFIGSEGLAHSWLAPCVWTGLHGRQEVEGAEQLTSWWTERGSSRKGPGQDTAPRTCPQWLASHNQALLFLVPTPPNNIFKVWVHQWIKLFIRSEPSWSNCLWKCPHRHLQRYALPIS
jgi:hypothetical protein